MRQAGEPTVEEILESIKRVIAREDRGERLARMRAEPPEPEDGGSDEPNPDVLELALHNRVADDPTSAPTAAPLMTEGAAASMRGSLDALAAASAQPSAASAPAQDGLEPLVRELLRPALADWLDRNLPAIVERMVAAEIARIAGGRP